MQDFLLSPNSNQFDQFNHNYYQHCETNQTQARQQNLYKTCLSTHETERKFIKSEFHLKENKFINQKKNNKNKTIDFHYHSTINNNNSDNEIENDIKIKGIKKKDYLSFYKHLKTEIEPLSKDMITNCYDDESPITLSSSHNIPNRLKSRDLVIQEKLISLPSQKTRSKMHDLAIKHKLITNQVYF